jgi:hypothetical protein
VTHAAQSDWRCEDIDTLAHFSAKVLAALTPPPAEPTLNVERLDLANLVWMALISQPNGLGLTGSEAEAIGWDVATRWFARLATEDKP